MRLYATPTKNDICSIVFFEIILYVFLLSSCNSGGNKEGNNDAFENERVVKIGKDVVFATIPTYDSIETMEIFDSMLCSSNYLPEEYNMFDDWNENLKLLPYLLMHFKDKSSTTTYISLFIDLCTGVYADKALYDLGREIVAKNDYQYEFTVKRTGEKRVYKYLSSFPSKPTTRSGYNPEYAIIGNALYGVDSLRVRVIAYNDRDALDKLERYYKKKGDDKGIAVYYKVMLGYEGNGDLAERFYKVLEPYFDETPEFRIAVREVLLRAAHCDHDRRAQELCDSLGFSLCDYRLPVISTENKN